MNRLIRPALLVTAFASTLVAQFMTAHYYVREHVYILTHDPELRRTFFQNEYIWMIAGIFTLAGLLSLLMSKAESERSLASNLSSSDKIDVGAWYVIAFAVCPNTYLAFRSYPYVTGGVVLIFDGLVLLVIGWKLWCWRTEDNFDSLEQLKRESGSVG